MPDTQERPTTGTMAAAISNSVVRLTHQYTGRGPTKARTTIADNLVVVVMADTMLQAERTLVDNGERESVLAMRRKFQRAMREALIDVVEEHTDRKVAAFMSDNHVDPDMGVEVFVLAPAA
jgi:uncharacterized protein YbcI